MTESKKQFRPAVEDTTADDDVWAAMPSDAAAIWRGLDALQTNMARMLREARADIQVGRLDRIADPQELRTAAGHALDALGRTGRTSETIAATLGDLAASYWKHIEGQRAAAPTGLAGLDRALGGGLQPGRLMALLGAPGKGKTTLANQIAEHLANGGRPVIYVTLEDTSWALLAKTIARVGVLNYGDVLQGRESVRSAITEALAVVANRRSASRLLYLEPAGRFSLAEMEERARTHLARFGADAGGGPGLLVVDYLQRAARAAMPGGVPGELRLAVSHLTDQLRELARTLDCSVLVLGSQNRSGYEGDNALVSGKESGDIEYGVDVLAALSQDEKNTRSVPLGCKAYKLEIAKNRQGDTAKLQLDWMGARQQFTEAGQ